MLIVRLAGGLGNQIFQLGAALLLAKKSGIKKIYIDDSALGNYDAKRENELLNFFDFSRLDFDVEFRNLSFVKLRIPKVLPLNVSKFPFVSDKNFQTILNSPNKSFMLLDGYFQKCLTQNNFDEEIQLLKKICITSVIEKKSDCVIHIRGGDFVKLGWNSVTPKEYYFKAIETMKLKYNQNKFYIVTDDRIYSKNILEEINIDYEFLGNSMQEDFHLIGSFKYRILSSSTFALWASALGNNEDSIVIAPKDWIPNHERKIYLSNEMRIDFE
jgi:hypothetical protein